MTKTATGIRLFEARDYQDIAAINNALWPEFPETAAEISHNDQKRDEDTKDPEMPIKWKRWVWEEDGRIVARGSFSQ